jgi:hypothetical protein
MGDPVRTAGCPLSVYDPCHLSGRIVIEPMSLFGTFRKCRNVRFESGMRTKADVRRPLRIYGFTAGKTIRELHELAQSGSRIDLLKDFGEVAREELRAFATL